MRNAVIVNAKRTVIGKKNGVLKHYSPEQLASFVIHDLTKELNESVDDIILGNTVGPGGNLGRLSALESGLPYMVPGLTVDRQCGSGLEAIRLACHLIQGGAGDIYIAGGVESVSTSPFKSRARFSPAYIGDPDMGIAAENIAEKYGITREMQDEFANLSYQRSLDSHEKGYFSDEMVRIADISFRDEGLKPDLNYERMLKRVSPCFKKNGTVTAGNSCGVNDGAAAVLIMSEDKAKELNLQPILRFVDSSVIGVDPNYPASGPIPAVSKLLFKNKLSIEDIDLIELNEAFAVKVALFAQALSFSYDRINPEGGAIALGHPYGASGAILVTRLFYEAQRLEPNYCISTIGIGGGLGIAVLWERIK
ncbi:MULTISPECIES: acetyl-CoA C-acyltransferase [Oceanobacillus]|uniref:acetyl-CoA C-acyltransferase n=1 Tax=Oceanobacillus TaxID=182709 RepID=UPI000BA6EDD6|nr:acetyl-CoA C-acyltransferase [Oceanobacillus profundus]MCM3400378.1 acetyl-CoA C-acyltransferase [Oceanobacillus profundus]PAE29430.1 acetyl-CoA acetyltransferase [Paenibacillus sp. 7884-2]